MNFLHRLATTLQKKAYAISEPMRMEDVCNMTEFNNARIVEFPFRHVVIDNAFTKEFYESVCDYFNKKKSEGLFDEIVPGQFHAFIDIIKPYDGYVLSLTHQPDAPTNFFFSNEWNLYFSKLFGRITDNTTALGFHFHKEGDKTGWVHSDYALKRFDKKHLLENKTISIPYETGGETGVTTEEQKNLSSTAFLSRRAITLLFYFNNSAGEGVGGGTGIYASTESTEPTKIIEPKNNRLFAFEVSPKSYHAFQTNQTDRSSLAQWFHVDNDWCKKHFKREA
jgi:hypothetical protein